MNCVNCKEARKTIMLRDIVREKIIEAIQMGRLESAQLIAGALRELLLPEVWRVRDIVADE